MKKLMILLGMVVMVIFSFTTMAGAFPRLPDNLCITQPDSSLPKELAAFWGKWEGITNRNFAIIVEKIDEAEASLYIHSPNYGWERVTAKVAEEYGKYKIWLYGRKGLNELSLRGKYLDLKLHSSFLTFMQVP